jgi:hypothetical protein
VVASRSGFFGLSLDTLLGLNAKGAAALPELLPLNFMNNAARYRLHGPINSVDQ